MSNFVRHKDLLEQREKLDLYRKDIRIIRNIYWEEAAFIQIENAITECIDLSTD